MCSLASCAVSLITILLVTNCSSKHVIQPEEELRIDKMAVLKKANHENQRVFSVSVENDSLHAIDAKTSYDVRYHRSEIHSITRTSRIRGALQATLIVGAGIAAFEEPLVGHSDGSWIMIPISLVSAPIVGFAIGNKKRYIFEHPVGSPALDDTLHDVISLVPPYEISSDTTKPPVEAYHTQVVSEESQTRLESYYCGLSNQVAVEGYWAPVGSSTEWAYTLHYRRYTSLALFQGDTSKADYRYYFGLSSRNAGGSLTEENIWSLEEGLAISYGVEWYRYGNFVKGAALFYEVGLMSGTTSRDDENDDLEDHRAKVGVIGVAGTRGWSRSIFGELQVGFDTISMQFIPSAGIGYRF